MDKKAVKYMVLILSVSILAQRPSAAESSIPTATPSTADKQEINTREADVRERSVRSDILQVAMPVDVEHVFDFIMDPQGLIGETDAAA